MKLTAVVDAVVKAGLLTADKAPQAIQAILVADRKAKDKDPEEVMDEREAACDEREEAMDAAEEKSDGAKDSAEQGKPEVKDRKGARDKRAKDRRDRAMGRDKRAKDRRAKDDATDPEGTNDNDLEEADPSTPAKGGKSEKGALDAAAVDARIAAAVASANATRDALHAARTEVQPILGVTTFDSAGETYRKALDKLGVDTKGIPESALRAMLTLAKDRASASQPTTGAADSATVSAVEKIIPGYGRLA